MFVVLTDIINPSKNKIFHSNIVRNNSGVVDVKNYYF